jgi:hypothetical protein
MDDAEREVDAGAESFPQLNGRKGKHHIHPLIHIRDSPAIE